MRLRNLSYLAVRILSIYLFIQGLNEVVNILEFTIPTYLQILKSNMTYINVFLMVGIPAVLMIIMSVILWFSAEKVSHYLIHKNSSDSVQSIQGKELEGFVLSVIGLILAILSITTLVRLVMDYVSIKNQQVQFNRQGYLSTITEQGIRFLIGIVLLLKAEGFALLLRKVRSFGLKHIKQDKF